ncbi:hypothetical protein ABTC06_19450, partial [Acinetobacter baumannii]
EPYADRVTGKLTEGVTSPQIFWGAVPFVVIQLGMAIALALFPGLVLHAGGKVAATPAPAVSTGSASRGAEETFGAPRLRLPGSPPRLEGA